MSIFDIKQFREILSDREQATEMAKAFAEYSTNEAEKSGVNGVGLKIYRHFLTSLAEKNMTIVQDHSESEIERLFLASTVLSFVVHRPFSAVFHDPFKDGLKSLQAFRENHEIRLKAKAAFAEATSDHSVEGFIEHLRKESDACGMSEEDIEHISADFYVYDTFALNQAIHLVPQARFPDIKNGKSGMRMDLFAFVPADPKVLIAVECDGYEFHSSADRFQSDRKRDRILKAAGIDVMRFSGSEIFRDPRECADEFVHMLESRISSHGDELESPELSDIKPLAADGAGVA